MMSPGLPSPAAPRAACRRRGLKLLALQLGALVAISILFAVLDLDRRIAALFYSQKGRWFLSDEPVWRWLYLYGTIPGVVLSLLCLGGFAVSFWADRLRPWRPYLLLVVLTTALAAGFFVNAVLKPYWGRPRPEQIREFGGHWAYRHVFPPGTPGQGASFPCGHCTAGYLFLSLGFCHRRSRALARWGVGTGLALGVLLSAGRVVQGAHFVTDTLWSLGIVSMTATALYYLVLRVPLLQASQAKPAATRRRKLWITLALILAAVLMTAAFMTRRPFYRTRGFRAALQDGTQQLTVQLNVRPVRVQVNYAAGEKARVVVHARGFGWAFFDYDVTAQSQNGAPVARMVVTVSARSYFAELEHSVEVYLPENLRERVIVEVQGP